MSLQILEDLVDMTREIRFSSSTSPIQTDCDTVGQLFRRCQKEYGKCVSKVYVDRQGEEAVPIGWVFHKRVEYSDCRKTYLQEAWITVVEPREYKRIDR
jgi:hypothetical protein